MRSRAAASTLANAGFARVHSMAGGIRSWDGLVAEGIPEADLAYFESARSAEEHVALAWLLEEGAREFYAEVAAMLRDREAKSLFLELTAAEEDHKDTLLALYEGLTARPAPADFPGSALPRKPTERLMEGGMRVEEALAWSLERPLRDILELAISLETNAFDRYLILQREVEEENSRRLFEVLTDEERRHLEKLSRLLDHFV